jgi:hypothetical protein
VNTVATTEHFRLGEVFPQIDKILKLQANNPVYLIKCAYNET